MKKAILIVSLFLYSALVGAGGIDIVTEIGYGYVPMPRDGTYWQEQMDHDSQMGGRAYSIGLALKTDNYNVVLAYDDLGQRQIWTYGYPDSEYSHLADDGVMPGESQCGGCTGYFYTQERLDGFRIAVTTPDSMDLYAEAGLFVYRSDLRMDLMQITEGHNHIVKTGDGDPLVGLSLALGYRLSEHTAIVARYYDTEGDAGMPVMADDVYTFSLQVKW